MRNSRPMRGRNFLMTPGPTNIPDRVLAAMHRPAVDLVDTDFMALTESCFDDLAKVCRTDGRVFLYASNGHGAWEAALANLIGEGDLVLAPSTGMFSLGVGQTRERSGRRGRGAGGRLAKRVRPRPYRGAAARGSGTSHQGGARSTDRHRDLGDERHRGGAPRPRRMPPPRAAHGRRRRIARHRRFPDDEWEVDVAVAGSQKG